MLTFNAMTFEQQKAVLAFAFAYSFDYPRQRYARTLNVLGKANHKPAVKYGVKAILY